MEFLAFTLAAALLLACVLVNSLRIQAMQEAAALSQFLTATLLEDAIQSDYSKRLRAEVANQFPAGLSSATDYVKLHKLTLRSPLAGLNGAEALAKASALSSLYSAKRDKGIVFTD